MATKTSKARPKAAAKPKRPRGPSAAARLDAVEATLEGAAQDVAAQRGRVGQAEARLDRIERALAAVADLIDALPAQESRAQAKRRPAIDACREASAT